MASTELLPSVLQENRRIFESSMNHARICIFLLLGVVIGAYELILEGKTGISSEAMICMTTIAFFS